jgi:hypothetical protein
MVWIGQDKGRNDSEIFLSYFLDIFWSDSEKSLKYISAVSSSQFRKLVPSGIM